MAWREHGDVREIDRLGTYRRYVRDYVNDEAPGAQVRITVSPVNTDFEDPDWPPESITLEGTWEFVLQPPDEDKWTKTDRAYVSVFDYPDDVSAEAAARRVIKGYKASSINWDGLSRVLPDLPWGREG